MKGFLFTLFVGSIFFISTSFKVANKISAKTICTDMDSANKAQLLFYIQLSENKNIIVYDINYNTNKRVNEEEPVKTYWIRNSEKGQKQELSYFQRHFVYGLESKLISKDKDEFILKFVSYKKKKIYLQKESGNKYCAYMDINGKVSLLQKIYIQVGPKMFGLPTVKYVELHGKEISSNNVIVERIIP